MKPNIEGENMIAFLIKNDICATFFDPKKHEQMIEVTKFGKDVHEILMHMIKTDNMEKLENPCESNKSLDGYHSYEGGICIFCGKLNQ